jgi:hypothetical protein
MLKTLARIHMRIGIILMPIRIRIGIDMEIRIRISIKTMPIHNTDLIKVKERNSIDVKQRFVVPAGLQS